MPRTPAPIHPGEILLEEFLNAYDPPVTQVAAAERMHIPAVRLNQLIRGNRGVTPDTALRLSDLTGTTPEFWLHLQTRYDLWRAQQDRARRKDAKIKALPRGTEPKYGVPDEENPEWTAEDFRTAKTFAEVFPDVPAPGRELRVSAAANKPRRASTRKS